MKLNYLFWSILLMSQVSIIAQVNAPFTNLSTTEVTTGIFYPQVRSLVNPPIGNDYDLLTNEQAWQIYYQFEKAFIDEEAMPEPQTFVGNLATIKRTHNAIPISVMDFDYDDFKDNTLSSVLIFQVDDDWFDTPNRPESPYESHPAFAVHIDAEKYTDEAQRFILPSQNYFTNLAVPSLIEIDFADGSGFQTITLDQVISITYADFHTDREIKIRVTRNGILRKGAAQLRAGGGEDPSALPKPNFTQRLELDLGGNNSPWEFCVDVNGTEVCANAYTLWGDDGILDKPFIFVEGIDFSYDHEPSRNGAFGWYEFSSGLSDDYAFLSEMPILLNALLDEDYDLILLDFYDGAQLVQSNAMLLVELIERVNDAKASYAEPSVIAGSSMGGQVTKYALSYMEQNGIKHCSRTWISLDSPHEGAYIPIGMQDMMQLQIDHSDEPEGAENFRDNYLKRPAARQLLNIQKFGPSLYSTFYAEMNDMGYPKLTRNIGIANGNGNGVGLNYDGGDDLLNWECDGIGGNDGGRLFIAAMPGADIHPENSGNQRVTAEFRTTEVFSLNHPSWTLFETVTAFKTRDLENLPRYDPMPGGYRTSIKEFKNKANLAISQTICDLIHSWEYEEKHCFVPTVSALGISNQGYYVNVNDLWDSNPELFPFDDIWTAPDGTNLQHSEVTSGEFGNIPFIFNEVINGQNQIGNELTDQSENYGVFNYGRKGDHSLYPVHVFNGGHLSINKFAFTHFQEIENFPKYQNLKMTTDQCGSVILVNDMGTFEIGDLTEPYTAELTLQDMTTFTIGESGILKINPGSKIIIEDGAELIIYPFSSVIADNGSIIVKAGGKLTIHAGATNGDVAALSLLNTDAVLVFDGGQLHIAANTVFEVNQGSATVGGYVEFKGADDHELFTGTNSKFKIVGDGPTDVMLKMNAYADLWNANWGQGEIILEDCKVDMSDHGRIWTDMKFTATDVTFEAATEQGEVQVWSGDTYINDCHFDQVSLVGVHSDANIFSSHFDGVHSGYQASEAAYYIYGSHFSDCGVRSRSLDAFSKIDVTQFDEFNMAIDDDSRIELMVSRCTIDDGDGTDVGDYGIFKSNGKLTLRCNSFEDVSIATYVEQCELNLRAGSGGGYNSFQNVDYGLWFEELAELPDFYQGFNNFTGCNELIMRGTVAIDCGTASNNCIYNTPIDGYNNHWGMDQWGLNNAQPDPATYNIITTEEDCYLQGGDECNIYILDSSPADPTTCGLGVLETKSMMVYHPDEQPTFGLQGVKETASSFASNAFFKDGELDPTNPLITTTDFDAVTLDSALYVAETALEIYDSIGSDMIAIDLFHQILTSGLDRTNSAVRTKMNTARYHMKSAMENCFIQGELIRENNETSFETPVQQYVDVLNEMTDTLLTPSTYKQQFNLEMDKGQLFRTLHKPLLARHIYLHLDDCDLDSTEQTILNNWLQQVDIELSIMNQYLNGVSPDSISFTVDTTSYVVPEGVVSDYYFGVWINSPTSVTFVNCGSNPVYRNMRLSDNRVGVYPNPSNGIMTITMEEKGLYQMNVLDMAGKITFAQKLNMEESSNINIDLSGILAKGNYMLVFESSMGLLFKQIVVE